MIEELDDEAIVALNDKEPEQEVIEHVDLTEDEMKEVTDKRRKEEENLSEEEIKSLYDEAIEEKSKGNELFGQQQYSEAIVKYNKCIEICPLKFVKEHSIFHGNISACYIKLEKFDKAITSADKAYELDPENLKFLERRGFARKNKKGDALEPAIEDYKLLIEKTTDDKLKCGYALKIKEIEELIKERNEKLKDDLINGLKKFGDICLKPFGLSTNNFELKQNEEGGYSINMKQ
uniref:TPR_REGION domain-containing protein n=1 Tax=Parastrongyloides trichosuri TaxID=131310 RepID=A0A0N4ZID5_PARTI